MTWSLFKDTNLPYEQWEENYVAWYVDEDMKSNYYPNRVKFLHDGPVEVYFDNDRFSTTVNVMNGKWEEDAERKILAFVRGYYHGEYIEMFSKRNGKIYVTMGS